MTKMYSKASSSRNAEACDDLSDKFEWIPTGTLDPYDNKSSNLIKEKFDEAKLLFHYDVVAALPPPQVHADWLRENWVCFYYYPFEIGMVFPFPKLATDVLSSLDVSIDQLMPSTWRTLACLEAVNSKHNLGIDVDVVKYAYRLKKYGGGQYCFSNNLKSEPLILNNDNVNDRGCKLDYFFVEKESLGEDRQCLRDRWNSKDPDFEFDDRKVYVKDVVEKILALLVCDRLWPNCLHRPIRNASG